MDATELKRIIEALLFVTDGPLTIPQIREVVETSDSEIRTALEAIAADSQARGVQLRELAGGWQLVTDAALAEWIRKFVQGKDKKKLSQAALETLSIVAYKQPLTRAEIEFIRGVNVDGAIKTLLEKGLLRISGRKEVPGRPILYSTTKDFLDHFGLGSLKDLPKLAEFSEKDIELPEHLKLKEKDEAAAQAPAPGEGEASDAPIDNPPTQEELEGEAAGKGENA